MEAFTGVNINDTITALLFAMSLGFSVGSVFSFFKFTIYDGLKNG